MKDWFSPPKKPATVLGMMVSISLMAIGTLGFGYLLVGPIVPIKVAAIITAAVLAPGITLGIFHQIRLRRALSRRRNP
jgi:hypothetical protein